jgi:predicted DNA binding CopG/RHH family protein
VNLTNPEQEIESLYESGKIVARKPSKALLGKVAAAAEATFRKDRRINIRLSEHDMVGIQRVAASKGIPYQTLISGLIHQYVEGDLVQKA